LIEVLVCQFYRIHLLLLLQPF